MNSTTHLLLDRSAAADQEPLETTIALGKTGAGKTTTLNAVTGLAWPTDPVVACTMQPTVAVLRRGEYPMLNRPAHRMVDLPGIGESVTADQTYLPMYQEWAARADRVLYIIQADTRTYKQDQIILTRIAPLLKRGARFTLAVNQVDRMAGWDAPGHQWVTPTTEQLRHLTERLDDVFEAFGEVLGKATSFHKSDVIPYAAARGWGLDRVRRLFFHVEG